MLRYHSCCLKVRLCVRVSGWQSSFRICFSLFTFRFGVIHISLCCDNFRRQKRPRALLLIRSWIIPPTCIHPTSTAEREQERQTRIYLVMTSTCRFIYYTYFYNDIMHLPLSANEYKRHHLRRHEAEELVTTPRQAQSNTACEPLAMHGWVHHQPYRTRVTSAGRDARPAKPPTPQASPFLKLVVIANMN